MRRFERLRRKKYEAGKLERGRSDAEPFQGDPLEEIIGECADGCNYADEAYAQNRLEIWRYRAIDHHLRQAAWLVIGALSDARDETDAGSEDDAG